jgi:hypothetical protein
MVRVVLVASLCLLACDPRIQPESPEARAAVPGAPPSTLGETCGSTAHCGDGLRCVEAVCVAAKSSRLGDYQQAAGRLALGRGDVARAQERFAAAIAAYEADKQPVPASLLCDAGAALRRKSGDAKAAEQAARLLHRCLLATPARSSEYARALVELAELEGEGLDATHLVKDAPSDMYLTRPAVRPQVKPVIALTSAAPPRDRGFTKLAERVPGEAALARCYQAYVDASGKSALAVAVELKARVTLGDDDVVEASRLDVGPAGADSGDAALDQAAACVRAALLPLAEAMGKERAFSSSWRAVASVEMKAP